MKTNLIIDYDTNASTSGRWSLARDVVPSTYPTLTSDLTLYRAFRWKPFLFHHIPLRWRLRWWWQTLLLSLKS